MIRPTRQELLLARDKIVPDLIAPDLRVLFCGINPGLYSAAVSHHFARPGNRFWPALFPGGFTPRLFAPSEEQELLPLGLGITNIVSRASAGADELSPDELKGGAAKLEKKVLLYRPKVLAVLGVGAYRTGFGFPRATVGSQQHRIGSTRVWILPNPSGLNAHYQAADLAAAFRQLHDAL